MSAVPPALHQPDHIAIRQITPDPGGFLSRRAAENLILASPQLPLRRPSPSLGKFAPDTPRLCFGPAFKTRYVG